MFQEISEAHISPEQKFPYSMSSALKKNNVASWVDIEVMKIQMPTFIFIEDKEIFWRALTIKKFQSISF